MAWGLTLFDGLGSYEAYRARLKSDSEARENFQMAQNKRLIIREERTFLEVVDETFGIPPSQREQGKSAPFKSGSEQALGNRAPFPWKHY